MGNSLPLDGVQARMAGCSVVGVAQPAFLRKSDGTAAEPAAERVPGGLRRTAHCPALWPVVASCAALLAGAVTLVLIHKAGITFLVIFVSSITIMILLMAESGHGLLAMTAQHGIPRLRKPWSPLGPWDLRGVAARIRHPRLIVAGFMPYRRHT